ncbi:uncharacterized protein isoform X4 [Rhodnius prolixus]|uniref:uncharacterized protein isoform X4 n=1 Tax=Rhodnius prolixus TaxID=13249 RepID=UPI003D18A93E
MKRCALPKCKCARNKPKLANMTRCALPFCKCARNKPKLANMTRCAPPFCKCARNKLLPIYLCPRSEGEGGGSLAILSKCRKKGNRD